MTEDFRDHYSSSCVVVQTYTMYVIIQGGKISAEEIFTGHINVYIRYTLLW